MNPYDTDYATNEFWAALKARLSPILGDVETTLGEAWMDKFEDCFSRTDFWALAAAKKSRFGSDWHVIELFDAAEDILDDEWIMAADSRTEAIAYLLYQCTEHGVWPDAVQYLESEGRIELALGGQAFAVIRKLPPSAVSIEVRDRVEGTLHGLRKTGKLKAEFAKRLGRWPGLSQLVASEDDSVLGNRDFHLPETSEWLLSAKQLAAMAGLPPLSTSQAQNLAAISFGEPSWNHLCGNFQDLGAARSLVSICCPWYIDDGSDGKAGECTVFQDFADAFQAFLDQAKDIVGSQTDMQSSVKALLSIERMPYFELFCKGPEKPTTKQIFTGEWDFGKRLSLCPVTNVFTDDVWLARVKTVAKKGDLEPALTSLFQIKQDASQRLKFRHAEKRLELIVQDGQWVFSFESQTAFNESRLEALCIDQAGNTLFAATAKLRKAQLTWNEALKAYVLSSDYDGKKPVAIIKGISKESAQLVIDHCHDSPMDDNFHMESSTYQNELSQLKLDMRRAGVLGI